MEKLSIFELDHFYLTVFEENNVLILSMLMCLPRLWRRRLGSFDIQISERETLSSLLIELRYSSNSLQQSKSLMLVKTFVS
jgi:hypothetical protein